MKKISKIISGIVVFIVFLFIGMFSAMFFLKDDVKAYAIEELNKQLKTEIVTEKISFSVFKKFPDASLIFKNVLIKSTSDFNKYHFRENTDTLCYAQEVALNFNIVDLLNKKYIINNISISNGEINIFTDKDENVNFKIWKENEDQNKSPFIIELSKIRLSEMNILYNSLPKEVYINTFTDKSELKGRFSAEQYHLATKGNFHIRKFNIDQTSYFENQIIKLNSIFFVEGDKYFINEGEVSIADLNFNLNGLIQQEQGLNMVNLQLNGKDLDINSFISILPEKTRKDLDRIKNSGSFYMNINIKGPISNKTNPLLKAHFGVSNGMLKLDNYDVENLFAEGYFTNGINKCPTSSFISFDTIYAKIEGNSMHANGIIKNFKDPKVHLYTSSDLKLNFINDILESKSITLRKGRLISDIEILGRITALNNITKMDYANMQYKGNCTIDGGEIYLPNENLLFSQISANATIDKHIKLSRSKFTVNEDNFFVKGTLSNVLPYFLLEKEKIWMNLDVKVDQFNLSNYLVSDAQVTENEDKGFGDLPNSIYIKLNLETKKFEHKTFHSTDLKAKMTYKPKMLIIQSFDTKTMGGTISGGGALIQRFNKEFIIKTQSKLKGIELNSLFSSFKNFGQNELKAEHLKGNISGRIDLYSSWDNDFNLIEDKLVVSSDLFIRNGELLEFEPMYGLAKFISLDELKDIKFSTLQNEILIKDKQIIIPEMEIKSSAFNISGSGVHNFDNSYTYKLRVLLSDVLFNKAKRRKKDIEEYATVEDDGQGKTSIYLSVKGKDSEYDVSYDKIAFRNKIKNDLKQEKQELKEILNEEFGIFKEDVEIDTTTREKPPVQINWDEEDEETELYDQKEEKEEVDEDDTPAVRIQYDDI